MTEAERVLWTALRDKRLAGWKFRRQFPIGRYVADFICLEARLIVEADGRPHDSEEVRLHDARRDAWLREQGFRILRLSNDLILGAPEIAVRSIKEALAARARSPSPVIASR